MMQNFVAGCVIAALIIMGLFASHEQYESAGTGA
jgi:hypothetical protein